MKDLRSELRREDPFARESGLSSADVDNMRRRILAARLEIRPKWSALFLPIAATVALVSFVRCCSFEHDLSPTRRIHHQRPRASTRTA